MQELSPLYEPWYTPLWHEPVVIGISLTVAVFLLGIVFWFIWRWYKHHKTMPLSAYEQVRIRLLHVRDAARAQRCTPSDAYAQATHALKTYLAVVSKQDDLPGKTDAQVIVFLKESNFDAHTIQSLSTFFAGVTECKFAPIAQAYERVYADIDALEVTVRSLHKHLGSAKNRTKPITT